MNGPHDAPLQVAAHTPEVLRGLDALDAGRPAFAVLSEIAWEGPVRDPETMKASDFLAQL